MTGALGHIDLAWQSSSDLIIFLSCYQAGLAGNTEMEKVGDCDGGILKSET